MDEWNILGYHDESMGRIAQVQGTLAEALARAAEAQAEGWIVTEVVGSFTTYVYVPVSGEWLEAVR